MKLEFPIIIKVVKKSFYKMVKSLKFMLQSQVSKWNNWLFNIINTFIYEMCFCNVKVPRVWLHWRKNDVSFCRNK